MPRMAPTVSVLARQTMRTAFEDLENAVSPVDLKQMRSVSAIQQVREIALDIEKQLAARRALRNMRRLAPLFQGLEHYSKAIEILSNGTPFLPWIWSPITIILKVASDHIDAFEQIIRGYSKIGEALGRFEILGEAFRSDATFQYSLAVYYSDILQFHKNAYKYDHIHLGNIFLNMVFDVTGGRLQLTGWHLLFNTSWGRFQRRFEGILQDLDRHGDLIDREANARNIAEAQRQREENMDKMEQEEKHQTTKQYTSVVSWLKVDDTEQIKVFESIHEEGSQYSGTCAWMTKNGKISSWLKSTPNDRQLWIAGNPGTGKSVMLTQLVTFLQVSESIVLYHFCRDTYSASTKYENILKSLIQQILRSSGELSAYAYHEYVVDRKKVTTKNLERLLENLLLALSTARKTENVWIIIDSIEDCEPAKQACLISLLYGLTSHTSQNATICKVLFSSRALPHQTKRFSKRHVLSLNNELEHVSKAIKLYTSQRLRSLHGRLRQLEMSADAVEHIEELITKKADGMFLYARLVLDYLSTNVFFDAEELEHSINKLPATVEEFYQNILAQMLANLDKRSVDRVRCVLEWIAFAKRPLNRLELLSALAFSSGRSDISSPAPKYVIDLCSPLIHEKQDTTLAFIHGSVKEFLQSSPTALTINERSALQEHGLATITCLLSGLEVFHENYGEAKRLLRLVKGVHGLHVYSTEHWSDYVLANAPASDGSPSWSISLLDAACRLAAELSQMTSSNVTTINSLDEGLKRLDSHSNLQLHVAKSLLARSQRSLEARILLSSENEDARAAKEHLDDGVSLLLDAYQKAIESLLDQDSCPGASVEELRFFKDQFRASAYTCRLHSCPRATIGFESAKSRHQHETGHVGGYRCSTTDCQYPPFRTLAALRTHTERHHSTAPVRKAIRKVGRLVHNDPSKLSPKSYLQVCGQAQAQAQARDQYKAVLQAQYLAQYLAKLQAQDQAQKAQQQQRDDAFADGTLRATPTQKSPGSAPTQPQQSLDTIRVTPQEVEALRMKLPANQANVPDSELRLFLWRKKMQRQPQMKTTHNWSPTSALPQSLESSQHNEDTIVTSRTSDNFQNGTSESLAGSSFWNLGTPYTDPRSQTPPPDSLNGVMVPFSSPSTSPPWNTYSPVPTSLQHGQSSIPSLEVTDPWSKANSSDDSVTYTNLEQSENPVPFVQEFSQQQQQIVAHSQFHPSEMPSESLLGPDLTAPPSFKNPWAVLQSTDIEQLSSAPEEDDSGSVPPESVSSKLARMIPEDQANTKTQISRPQLVETKLPDGDRDDSSKNFGQPISVSRLLDSEKIFKCRCDLGAVQGVNDIQCRHCNTWQHFFCYYSPFSAGLTFHFCVGCQPIVMGLKIANVLNRTSKTPNPAITHQMKEFLQVIFDQIPQSYAEVLKVFQRLKEPQQDYGRFISNLRIQFRQEPAMISRFLSVLTEASKLREAGSNHCVYCDRVHFDLKSIFCFHPRCYKKCHLECLLFQPTKQGSFCASCMLDILASEGNSVDDDLEFVIYKALRRLNGLMEQPNTSTTPERFPDSMESNTPNPSSEESVPQESNASPSVIRGEIKAYPTAPQPLWEDVIMRGSHESATPLLDVPTEAGDDRQSAQSNALGPLSTSPIRWGPLYDATELALVMGIPEGIQIPSLRVIHADIHSKPAGYSFYDFADLMKHRAHRSTWPLSTTQDIVGVIQKLLPAIPLIAHWEEYWVEGMATMVTGLVASQRLPEDDYVYAYMLRQKHQFSWKHLYPEDDEYDFKDIDREGNELMQLFTEWKPAYERWTGA